MPVMRLLPRERMVAFRKIVFLVVILALGSAGPASPVWAQGNTVAPAPSPADDFIDRGTVMAACGVGVAWGAVSLATYPLWKWAKDAGAVLSMGVMAWRSVLGCYYGILAGVLYSGANSTLEWVDEAVTGPPEPTS